MCMKKSTSYYWLLMVKLHKMFKYFRFKKNILTKSQAEGRLVWAEMLKGHLKVDINKKRKVFKSFSFQILNWDSTQIKHFEVVKILLFHKKRFDISSGPLNWQRVDFHPALINQLPAYLNLEAGCRAAPRARLAAWGAR